MITGNFDIYSLFIFFTLFYTILITGANFLPFFSSKIGRLQSFDTDFLNTPDQDNYTLKIIKKTSFYIRQNKKKLFVNATVKGYFNSVIIIDQYLLDLLDKEEIKAIIYHEIYHISRRHNIRRFLTWISLSLLPMLFAILLDNIPERFIELLNYIYLSKYIYLVTIFVFVMVYLLVFLMILHVFRKQEIEADLFAKNKIRKKEKLISALRKLARINKEKEHRGCLRNLFALHPCLLKRVDYINKG